MFSLHMTFTILVSDKNLRHNTIKRGEQEVSATGGLGASEPGERGGEWAREDRPCEG